MSNVKAYDILGTTSSNLADTALKGIENSLVREIVAGNKMDDGGKSYSIRSSSIAASKAKDLDDIYYKNILHYYNLYGSNEIDLYNKTYRFGLFNPNTIIGNCREFLFFTKPDLNILKRDDNTGDVYPNTLNPAIEKTAYWKEMLAKRKEIIKSLQLSANDSDMFNHLLQNQCSSNLEIPSLSAQSIETPTNMYGVGFNYRGSSEAEDDNPDFSLEFRDTKWLDVYHFFKSYEEYETLKHHGLIRPWVRHIERKQIHDQFAIYKFIVAEDMETILYYGKLYGVMPMSLPRDIFNNVNFENGFTFTINFKAAFYDDMKPEILGDFNSLSKSYFNSQPYRIDVFNDVFDRSDSRPAKAAFIEEVDSKTGPGGKVYKLRWRGSDVY